MKFKKGDRVILNDTDWPDWTTGVVVRDQVGPQLSVRFDHIKNYGTHDNAHSGFYANDFELDILYDSPLCKALR